MDSKEKENIVRELQFLCSRDGCQQAARKTGISTALIGRLLNDKDEELTEQAWQKIRKGLRADLNWVTAETKNFKMLQVLLRNAQQQSISVAVSHNAGAGKSYAYKYYQYNQPQVICLECKTYWTRKNYMKSLCSAAGLNEEGSIGQLAERFVNTLKTLHKPFVIVDQLDKLNDSSLDLFMDFYNDLDGRCGFLVSGVPALKKRILRGCQLDKSGYKEFYSRVGKTFIYLDEVSFQDVRLICQANGVDDQEYINHIFHVCEGDLRKVRREVNKYFLTQYKSA